MPTDVNSAGNVIYKGMRFRCSMRIPPHMSAKEVVKNLKKKLMKPGPETFGAKIEFECLD